MPSTKELIILCFIIAQANSAVDRTPRVTSCIRQIQPSKEEVASFRRREIPTTDKGKCLLACYLESRGVLQNGKFSQVGAMQLAARAYPGNAVKTGHVRHILSHCGATVSNDKGKCEFASSLADCTTGMSSKFKL